MRQATLKLKITVNKSIANSNVDIAKAALNTMLTVIGGLTILYVFILGNMVYDILERRVLEKEYVSLSNEVGSLEVSYLSMSKNVDLALSAEMGFKETKATFATRKSLGSLKVDSNEI